MRVKQVCGILPLLGLCSAAFGCGKAVAGADLGSSWAALMEDGPRAADGQPLDEGPAAAAETSATPGSASAADPAPTAPAAVIPRNCPFGDCSRAALASWNFNDCNTLTTELADQSFTSLTAHPAYRSVSTPCVVGHSGAAVQFRGPEDVVYAPDQPDFVFTEGLTIAAWIEPNDVDRTQTIVRKRFGGTSTFTVAIRDGQLAFAVQLADGALTGVQAPLPAGSFSHFAGTYDGQVLSLYLNGALAASTPATGALAAGSGPLFIGNDADGRRFAGIIDDVWLNDQAAAPTTIADLSCGRGVPLLALTPSSIPATPAGSSVTLDLSLTSTSGATCSADTLYYFASTVPDALGVDPRFAVAVLEPGQTVHIPVHATASDLGDLGSFSFEYTALNAADVSQRVTASATLEVTAAPPLERSGCAAEPTQPTTPGGYYVNGNTVCTEAGRAHLFHGVDRPSLEWVSTGINLSAEDFQLMASWNANVVRIALNQDFWLAGSPLYDPSYAATLDSAILWAEAAGLDVILDLHWSDAGVLGSCVAPDGSTCQQLMPDQNSVSFWSEVAARYAADPRVLFELFNEPHDVSWDIWQLGGDTGAGWNAVGMQALYDTVRATGSHNLVLIGGLDWAYDLSGVPEHRIQGYNILYATHPYSNPASPGRPPSDWARAWGSLTRTDPVVVTEFGSLADPTCATDYGARVMQYAESHFAGWTAWAWFPGGCTFPALIEDWDGTPSPSGALVKAALLADDDPPAALRP